MNLFDVYTLCDIEPVLAKGCQLWDKNGIEYLDFYGGHAVISIGHSHPKYVEAITQQVNKIGFYSNSVQNSLQQELATKLGELSNYPNYSLFLCNSGAEANENALKLASFQTGKDKVLAFFGSFHGRTSGAVAVTDNHNIQSPFNTGHKVNYVPLNDINAVEAELSKGDYAAVIIEGIQGVSGIFVPENNFLKKLQLLCNEFGVMLILDEVQSGYGRTGKFFSHQYANVTPDMITIAKGMGNGFPIGGVLISPDIEAKKGMLGTTFGGNHLACAAAIAVLDVIKEESLIENAEEMGYYIQDELDGITGIDEVRGRGLMIGVELESEYADLRSRLLYESHIFTGAARNNVLRLLPPLCVSKDEIEIFIQQFKKLTSI